MNSTRIVHLVSILLVSCLIAVSQDRPTSVLVDEHGDIPCDDSMGRLDNFYAELHQNPGSTGLIVITNPADSRRGSVFKRRMIENYARFRGFELKRIKIVREVGGDDLRLTFWR